MKNKRKIVKKKLFNKKKNAIKNQFNCFIFYFVIYFEKKLLGKFFN